MRQYSNNNKGGNNNNIGSGCVLKIDEDEVNKFYK